MVAETVDGGLSIASLPCIDRFGGNANRTHGRLSKRLQAVGLRVFDFQHMVDWHWVGTFSVVVPFLSGSRTRVRCIA
jgi:hypothetical protein